MPERCASMAFRNGQNEQPIPLSQRLRLPSPLLDRQHTAGVDAGDGVRPLFLTLTGLRRARPSGGISAWCAACRPTNLRWPDTMRSCRPHVRGANRRMLLAISSVDGRVNDQDHNNGTQDDHPIGNLNACYRCLFVKPFHDVPPIFKSRSPRTRRDEKFVPKL
jgi:hypothetical protein